MRHYNDDPFERLLAEVVCELAKDLAKPQPQDFQKKHLTSNGHVVVLKMDEANVIQSDSEANRKASDRNDMERDV